MNTVEKIILLFLLLGNIGLSAQEVRFEPIFLNLKTHEIDTRSTYNQNDSTIISNEFSNDVELPDIGTYRVRMSGYDIQYDIHTNSTDAFYYKYINSYCFALGAPPVYQCGDKLCDGLEIDYHYNGNIRMIGTFKNGQPIDTLKEYYEDGKLKSIEYKSPNKYISRKSFKTPYYWMKSFSKEGVCITEFDNKIGKDKYYYPSGNLQIIFKSKHNFISKYYYENGKPEIIIKKWKRKKYHENGVLAIKVKKHGLFYRYFSRIVYTQYDSTGKYVQKKIFYDGGIPDDITTLPWKKFDKIKYNTRPKTKDVISTEKQYKDGQVIGRTPTKTTYQKQKGKWVEIKKEEWKDNN